MRLPLVNDHDYDVAHRGWEPLVDWVAEHQPRHLLHGHTYPEDDQLVRSMGPTAVHYVHGWAVLDLR